MDDLAPNHTELQKLVAYNKRMLKAISSVYGDPDAGLELGAPEEQDMVYCDLNSFMRWDPASDRATRALTVYHDFNTPQGRADIRRRLRDHVKSKIELLGVGERICFKQWLPYYSRLRAGYMYRDRVRTHEARWRYVMFYLELADSMHTIVQKNVDNKYTVSREYGNVVFERNRPTSAAIKVVSMLTSTAEFSDIAITPDRRTLEEGREYKIHSPWRSKHDIGALIRGVKFLPEVLGEDGEDTQPLGKSSLEEFYYREEQKYQPTNQHRLIDLVNEVVA